MAILSPEQLWKGTDVCRDSLSSIYVCIYQNIKLYSTIVTVLTFIDILYKRQMDIWLPWQTQKGMNVKGEIWSSVNVCICKFKILGWKLLEV